ncbi:MAG: hypothetical protein V4657_06850 [Pseudomonadota bacterium]
MDIIILSYIAGLTLCSVYASVKGGRTGKAGSAIFITATILSSGAAQFNPDWATMSLGLLIVDGGCLLALLILAQASDRYWPIWAAGFQAVAVATHLATLSVPDIVPKSYQALSAFWAIPILWVMVDGTRKDRRYERGKFQPR